MSNEDRSRRVWRLLERGWTGARALRDAIEQVRGRVDEARVRISDEVVSRIAGQPVRTQPDPSRTEPPAPSPQTPSAPPRPTTSEQNEVVRAADAVSEAAVAAEASQTAPVVPTEPIFVAQPAAKAPPEPASLVSDLPPLPVERPPSPPAEARPPPAPPPPETPLAGDWAGAVPEVPLLVPTPPDLETLSEIPTVSESAEAAEGGPASDDAPSFTFDEPMVPAPRVMSEDLPDPAAALEINQAFDTLFGGPAEVPLGSDEPALEDEALDPFAGMLAADLEEEAPLDVGEIVVLARDAEWLFVYWELKADQLDAIGSVGADRQYLLRIVQPTGSGLVHQSSAAMPSGQRYIRVPFADASYQAELWVRGATGERLVARSLAASTPPMIPRPAHVEMVSSVAHRGVLNSAWDLSSVPRLKPEDRPQVPPAPQVPAMGAAPAAPAADGVAAQVPEEVWVSIEGSETRLAVPTGAQMNPAWNDEYMGGSEDRLDSGSEGRLGGSEARLGGPPMGSEHRLGGSVDAAEALPVAAETLEPEPLITSAPTTVVEPVASAEATDVEATSASLAPPPAGENGRPYPPPAGAEDQRGSPMAGAAPRFGSDD